MSRDKGAPCNFEANTGDDINDGEFVILMTIEIDIAR